MENRKLWVPGPDPPSTRRHQRLWARRLLRGGIFFSTAGSPLLPALAALRSESGVLTFGALIVATGIAHLARVLVHRMDREYMRAGGMEALVDADQHLALTWIALGIALVALVVVEISTLVVAASGVVGSLFLFLRGIAIGADSAALEAEKQLRGGSEWVAAHPRVRRWGGRFRRTPGQPVADCFPYLFGRKRRRGHISAYLHYTLLVLSCAATGLGGVSVAEVVAPTGSVAPGASAGPPEAMQPRHILSPQPASLTERVEPPTYADLCPELSDPHRIGHRLGELFAEAGAVEAGCAEQAQSVGPASSVWIAAGYCGSELRSLAVTAPSSDPVLLYGEPARFALAAARAGRLRLAERDSPGGGDAYLVATDEGAHVFVRRSSSYGTGSLAHRCEEVDEVARPFTHLPPSLSGLWARHVRERGWAWPHETSGGELSVGFTDDRTGRLTARGRCSATGACVFDGPSGLWDESDAVLVSFTALRPFMPREPD